MKHQLIEELFNYKGKIVFITGTSGLLGSSLVNLFLKLGSIVIGVDIKKNKITHKNFLFLKINIANDKDVKKILQKIIKKHNKIDIIINNAGVSFFTKFEKRTSKELINTFNVNLVGTLNVCKNYFALHKKLKLKKCNIINIGSIYGSMSPDFRIYDNPNNYNSEIYGSTKAGVIQLTKYLAVLMSKHKININCMSPGGILNKNKRQNNKFIRKYSNRIPINRMANTEDFFTCILFLSSEKSKYITGQNIIIDGGLSAW